MDQAEAEYTWLFRTEFGAVVRTLSLVLLDRDRAEQVAEEAFTELLDALRDERPATDPDLARPATVAGTYTAHVRPGTDVVDEQSLVGTWTFELRSDGEIFVTRRRRTRGSSPARRTTSRGRSSAPPSS